MVGNVQRATRIASSASPRWLYYRSRLLEECQLLELSVGNVFGYFDVRRDGMAPGADATYKGETSQ